MTLVGYIWRIWLTTVNVLECNAASPPSRHLSYTWALVSVRGTSGSPTAHSSLVFARATSNLCGILYDSSSSPCCSVTKGRGGNSMFSTIFVCWLLFRWVCQRRGNAGHWLISSAEANWCQWRGIYIPWYGETFPTKKKNRKQYFLFVFLLVKRVARTFGINMFKNMSQLSRRYINKQGEYIIFLCILKNTFFPGSENNNHFTFFMKMFSN